MRNPLRLLTVIVLGLGLYGCRQATDETEAASAPAEAPMAMEMAAPGADGAMMKQAAARGAEADVAVASGLDALAQSSAQRQIIRTGVVTIEAADARKAAQTLTETVTKLGGFIGNSSEDVNELGGRTVTIEARVPAARYDELMRSLDKLGTVLSRNVNAQDVTEEYVDVEAKLRNLKRTEARLLDHLSRSAKLSDTLLVERELTRVREQVEQYEGRMRYLKHNVAFSSASVTIRDRARKEPLVPPESYSTGQVASSAVRALVDFGRSIWTMVVWFAVWSPVWLPGLLFLLYLSRRTRRRKPHQPGSAP